MTLQRFYNKLGDLFWSITVLTLVTAAVLFSLVRLALPYANDYRVQVETALSAVLGQEVTVAGMTAELNGVRPALVLQGVTVYDHSGEERMFQFDSLSIGFSLWKSALEKKPIPVTFEVHGSSLSVRREQGGTFYINEVPVRFDMGGSDGAEAAYQPALLWLFEHGRVRLDGVALDYDDRVADRHLQLSDIELRLRNAGDRHQLDASVPLPSGLGKRLVVALDTTAMGLGDYQDWQTTAYLAVEELNLARALAPLQHKPLEATEGVASLRLWSQWQGLKPTALRGEVEANQVQLAAVQGDARFALDGLNADFTLGREEGGDWLLDIGQLQLTRAGKVRDPSRLQLGYRPGTGDVVVRASLLYLEDLRELMLVSGLAQGKLQEALAGAAPSGEVHDLQVHYGVRDHGPANYQVAFRAVGLATQSWAAIPRLQGIGGTVWIKNGAGAALINSEQASVHVDPMFRHPWQVKRLTGLVQWRQLGRDWHIQSERLDIEGRDMHLEGRVNLLLANDRHPAYLDLYSRLYDGDISQTYRYYPVTLMSPKVVEWLDRALVAGRAEDGSIIYRGWLQHGAFPFREHQGKFEVAFQGRDARLEYLPEWPAMERLNAALVFDGPGMEVQAQAAQLHGMQVDQFSAVIPDFHAAELALHGRVSGDTGQALGFIAHSPLREPFSAIVGRTEASGSTRLDLAMQIPLAAGGGVTRYQGRLALADSRFTARLGAGRLRLEAVAGELQFSERGYTTADPIRARLLQRPVEINFTTTEAADTQLVEMVATGSVPLEPLQAELKLGLLDSLQGESGVTLRLQMERGGRQETRLALESQLIGTGIALPQPFTKEAEVPRPLRVSWDNNTRQLGVQLGSDFQGALWLDEGGEELGFRRGNLHFGPGVVEIPEQDVLRLSGSLRQFPMAEWIKFFSQVDGVGSVGGRLPVEVRLDRLEILPESPTTAPPARAQAGKSAAGPQAAGAGPLPNLDIEVADLHYKEIRYGKFTLKAQPFTNGYKIDALDFQGPLLSFASKGYWQQGRDPLTALSIKVEARSTEALLSTYGFSTPIRGGAIKVEGNLQWPGSPDRFSLEQFEGNVNFRISDGRLDNIEPGAGRVLGLLSFQALPRRLALDFRDLFGKGYRFDNIQGEIKVEGGNAYTKNLTINSPAARVTMSGRAGLVARDYDQDVIIIPGDGTNLFVAGALAGGIQTGVVVWLVEKVLNVDKYSRFIYKITGTWENPVVTSLGQTSAEPAPSDIGE